MFYHVTLTLTLTPNTNTNPKPNRNRNPNTPFTRYNRLSTGLITVLNEQPLFVQPVVKPGCTTGLTIGCIHDTAGCQTGCQMGLTTG